MKTTVTDRIFEIITQNDINDAQLSRSLGVSRTTVSEWKTGKSSPSPKIVIKIIDVFPEVDANWLIRGTEMVITNNSNNQKSTGKRSNNTITNVGGNMVNETTTSYNTENEMLKKQIIEKDAQIALLKELLKK